MMDDGPRPLVPEPVSSRRLSQQKREEIEAFVAEGYGGDPPPTLVEWVRDLLHDLRVVEEAAQTVVDERDNPFLGHAIDALGAALSEPEEPKQP